MARIPPVSFLTGSSAAAASDEHQTSPRPSAEDQSFLKAFTEKSLTERQTFLSLLANRFRPSDWWHISSLLNQRLYYCDIVGLLPLDLALLILENVHPVEICKFRLVSRRWNELLSSEDVCRAVATKWYKREIFRIREERGYNDADGRVVEEKPHEEKERSHPLPFRGKLPEDRSHEEAKKDDPGPFFSWKIVLEDIASRKQQFRHLRAIATNILDDNPPAHYAINHGTGRFATVSGHVCNVYDLAVNKRHGPMKTADRSSILEVALGSSFVAMVTDGGKCYVRLLSYPEVNHDFRFPNANLMELIADETLIVGLFKRCFVIHDVNSKVTRGLGGDNEEYKKFFLNKRHFIRAMLDVANGKLVMLRLPTRSERDIVGVISTFSTHTGELMDSRTLSYENPRPGHWGAMTSLLPDAYSGNGIYTLFADAMIDKDSLKVFIRRKFWDKEKDEVGEDEWIVENSSRDAQSAVDWSVQFWDDSCYIRGFSYNLDYNEVSLFCNPVVRTIWPNSSTKKLHGVFTGYKEIFWISDRFIICSCAARSELLISSFLSIHQKE